MAILQLRHLFSNLIICVLFLSDFVYNLKGINIINRKGGTYHA